MWKRLNNSKGARLPPIGEPVLHETTLDEKSYGGLGISTQHTDRNRAPPRPPRESMEGKGLPRLPYDQPSPEYEDTRFRPASSLYSQPSPNPIHTRFPRDSYATPEYPVEEVSPPSSPEFDAPLKNRSQSQEEEVSPIDEMPDVSKLGFGERPGSSSKPSSNIPILRREKRRNQVSATAANLARKEVGDGPKGRIFHEPRWDPYSGEITTSERGKPQSVKPGQFAPPGLRPVHKETGIVLGNDSSVSATQKQHTSFSDRVRNFKSKPTEKPEWKGATGRTTLVSPVADRFDLPPISVPRKQVAEVPEITIPRKSSKRVTSPHSGSFSGNSTPVTIVRSGDGETSPASQEYTDPTIRTVLSHHGRDSPRGSPITITPDPVVVNQSAATDVLSREPHDRADENKYNQKSYDPDPTFSREESHSTLKRIERNFREAFQSVSQPATIPESEPYEQPPSRFSVTTYSPSEHHPSPRPSNDYDTPPMPSQTFDPASVLNRKRPKVSESPRPNVVSRKAINPGSPVFISMATTVPSKRSSNVAKNLPMSPAEAQSHDLVTSLQAQLDNLAHRRTNIMRSIRQMTELMPKDSVLVTEDVRRKREEEKRKVESLREEEADIRREEHEIGLRLHRAWKRRDKEAVYEPTGLWVRRVTG